MQATIEEALKPLFNQWLEEAMPEIEERLSKKVVEDVGVKTQQTLFTQKEMAKLQNVSVTTFKKWREQGLQSEPNPTGKLLFDINKVNKWREENDNRKER